jgi:hypothetical protein
MKKLNSIPPTNNYRKVLNCQRNSMDAVNYNGLLALPTTKARKDIVFRLIYRV